MRSDETNRQADLRALLRALRGARSQRAVAEAAGVSLSLYRKLESGRAANTQVRNLIRIAQSVEAGDRDRALLIRLARPDLARMLPPERERWTEESLRSLRGLASDLLRAKSPHRAVLVAVELLYASLEPDRMAFALERRADGTMRMHVSLGEHVRARLFAACASSSHVLECDDVRVVSAPIRVRERVEAALGIAFGRRRSLGERSRVFLETVAAILEVRLSERS